MDVLTKAVSSFGTASELCRKMSSVVGYPHVTPQILAGWRRRGQVPDDRVWQFSRATGIPPWEVRPDLYDRPEVYTAKVVKFCVLRTDNELL